MPSSAFHAAATVCLRRLAVAVLACVAGFGGTAQAAEPEAWKLDPVHTRVVFAVSHAGFSSAIGTVSGSEGGLLYTPGEWDGARLVVEVPITRLDLGDADWSGKNVLLFGTGAYAGATMALLRLQQEQERSQPKRASRKKA